MSDLRRIGALWRPRPGSTVIATGVATIAGMRQRFFVVPNDRKHSEGAPDFVLLTNTEPGPAPRRYGPVEPRDVDEELDNPFA
jgi:hypothetical protein